MAMGISNFIIKPFGLEQIRTLYRYVEENNASLINDSLHWDHSLWSIAHVAYVCMFICTYLCYILCVESILSIESFCFSLFVCCSPVSSFTVYSQSESLPLVKWRGSVCWTGVSQLFLSQDHCVWYIAASVEEKPLVLSLYSSTKWLAVTASDN